MNIEQVSFKDIVDLKELKLLFEQFSKATGFTTGLVDQSTKEVLLATGWRDICVKFHRACPDSRKHCQASNKELTTGLDHAGEIRINQCENGLIDGCTPIIIQGKHFATLFTGQVLFTQPDKELFRKQAQKYGYNEQAYLESLAKVPVISEEEFSTMLHYLAHTASMIAQTGLANLKSKKESTKTWQRLQLALEGGELGMWDWNIQSNTVYYNPQYFAMLGYGPTELPHTLETFTNLIHPDDREMVKQLTQSCLEKTPPKWHLEFRLQARDGHYLWILARGKVVEHSQDGLPLRAVGTHLDITASKTAEQTLKENELRFRQLYDSAPLPYQSLDYDGFFIDVNQAWLDTMGGYTKDDVIGRSFGDFLIPDWKAHFKYNFPRFKDKGEILGVEFEMVKKDGSVILVHFNGKIGYDEQGNFLQTHCIFQDITRHRENEEAIRKSKEEWEKTFDAMTDIVTVQDKDMRIIRANKAAYQLFQVEDGELNNKYCYEIFTGKSEPCPGCPLLDTLKGIEHHSEIMTHENLGKTFQVSSSAITTDDGELQYLIHVAKDITEQKRIEEELFQAHKMEAMGTLAGGIAHDFNNILTAIIGFSELAKDDIPADSNATKDIDQVLESSSRAADLVQQILTFSRKSDHRLEPIAPHLIIKEALKMLRSSLPVTIDIQENITNECGKIMADPTNIHQIIVNLCTNSLHAMEDEKGILRVSLQQKEISSEEIMGEPGVSPGQFVVLEVSDTGQGMNQATIERIFEPYFTTKEVGKGTGLGLAVIHGIIQDYHGFIRVKSEPGQGTTFYVHIPALPHQPSTTAEIRTDAPLPTGTEGILVVDDESMIVNINKAILEHLGYKVMATTDSLDALEKIRTAPDQFDLIITDQTMPNLTGAELAQKILQIKPTMPIILCTGYSSVLSEEDALAIGIKKYARKPVDRATLAKVVREVLDDK
jgi:PAS domain S-box-containing protein